MVSAKGISQHWTEGRETLYEEMLKRARTFAERHLIMTIRDLMKYDQRTREAKRAVAQGRLRLTTASDDDLKELAALETLMTEPFDFTKQPERYQRWKELRDHLREKRIKRGDIALSAAADSPLPPEQTGR